MHWVNPVTMAATFVAGVALAIGHHFFYRSLDQTIVSKAAFGQQVNLGIGTAFTFLIRSLLLTTIGVAYTQVLWRRLRTNSTKLNRVDSLVLLLTSLMDFLNVKVLVKNPGLAVLAIISWTLPIAMIIPPATLSVHTSQDYISMSTIVNLSAVDYGKDNNFAVTYGGSGGGSFGASEQELLYYGGTMQNLTRLALSTAMQGQILPMTPPVVNSTYNSTFYAPAVQCQRVSTSILLNFTQVVDHNLTSVLGDDDLPLWSYIAWVPGPDFIVPFNNNASRYPKPYSFLDNFDSMGLGSVHVGGMDDGSPAALYVAARAWLNSSDWTVLNCSLFNASYHTTYHFENGHQSITASRSLLNGVPLIKEIALLGSDQGISFTPNSTTQYYVTPDHVSYQAMMDTLGQILVGQISIGSSDSMSDFAVIEATSVRSTNLYYTTEVGAGSGSLADQISELFENITLSLLTMPDFVSTGLDASGKPNANVNTNLTVLTLPNIYMYTWWKLVLAYSIAVAFTAIILCVGVYTFVVTSESYSTTFSTIIRSTQDMDITGIASDDDRGADPLPKALARVEVQLGPRQNNPADNQAQSRNVSHASNHRISRAESEMSEMANKTPHLDLIETTTAFDRDYTTHDGAVQITGQTRGPYHRVSITDPEVSAVSSPEHLHGPAQLYYAPPVTAM